VRQEFRRAYNAKDVDAVVALYAEDATLVSDGGTFKGRDEIRNWVKSGLDQGSRLEAIEPSVEKSSGTLAYETGRTRVVGFFQICPHRFNWFLQTCQP
jgi:ketosteroid isomerase-like protein